MNISYFFLPFFEEASQSFLFIPRDGWLMTMKRADWKKTFLQSSHSGYGRQTEPGKAEPEASWAELSWTELRRKRKRTFLSSSPSFVRDRECPRSERSCRPSGGWRANERTNERTRARPDGPTVGAATNATSQLAHSMESAPPKGRTFVPFFFPLLRTWAGAI